MLFDPATLDFVRGDATGLDIPAHPQALLAAGAAWLTRAFQAYGAISPGNAITRITRSEPCLAGNSGEKLWLSVEYAKAEPGLHTDLFVKFSRHRTDPFRDRRRHELAGEVNLAALSRLPAFPVHVAAPCFADFDPASGTGLLITQQIAFGEDGIEPLRLKNMDHELADPLEYYQATLTALARLAAAHQSGRLSPEVDGLFPFAADAATSELTIPFDRPALLDKVKAIGGFIESYPWLLLDRFPVAEFVARLERDALALLEHEDRVKHFLYGDPRFIALTHWNTHIDNAWFWRDDAGVLQCGLLDWGMVRQMNFTIGVWGGLSGAMPGFLDQHLDELLARFVHELRCSGGADIAPGEFRLHFDLSVAMIGMALLMDAPTLVGSRLPEIDAATSLTDPVLRGNQVGSGFLHTFAAFLNLWARNDFGASLATMLAREEP